jgi:hypothetical protein
MSTGYIFHVLSLLKRGRIISFSHCYHQKLVILPRHSVHTCNTRYWKAEASVLQDRTHFGWHSKTLQWHCIKERGVKRPSLTATCISCHPCLLLPWLCCSCLGLALLSLGLQVSAISAPRILTLCQHLPGCSSHGGEQRGGRTSRIRSGQIHGHFCPHTLTSKSEVRIYQRVGEERVPTGWEVFLPLRFPVPPSDVSS